MLASLPDTAWGQFGGARGRATVIENVTIQMMNGETIENGIVIMRGDRIEALGAGLSIPENSTVVDGEGGWVTPGLIDVSGSVGLISGGNNAIHRAMDGFDQYSSEEFREAVRHGVTTMYLPARGGGGVNGLGTIVRLTPRDEGGVGEALVEDAALCINFASGHGAIERLGTYQGLREAFKSAKAYRESVETYEIELEEYLEKLEERAKAAEKKDAEAEKKKESDEKKSDAAPTQDPGRRRRPGNGNGGQGGSGNDGEKADEKKEEIKKPSKPGPNRSADVLLKAIDGELTVRAVAHRDEDILNALALAEEYGLKMVIEGATEAHRVADALAAADVKVVLDAPDEPFGYRGDWRRLASVEQAQILNEAGVQWVVGTGSGSEAEGRFVLASAMRLVPHIHDASSRDAVRWVTRDAAEFLGVSDRVGRLGRGRLADVVVWSGDPGEASSRVMRTYVGGRLLYRAE